MLGYVIKVGSPPRCIAGEFFGGNTTTLEIREKEQSCWHAKTHFRPSGLGTREKVVKDVISSSLTSLAINSTFSAARNCS